MISTKKQNEFAGLATLFVQRIETKSAVREQKFALVLVNAPCNPHSNRCTSTMDDNDVELVERHAIHNSIEKVVIPRPLSERIRRQNTYWITGFFAFILGIGILLVLSQKQLEGGKNVPDSFTDDETDFQSGAKDSSTSNDNLPSPEIQKVKDTYSKSSKDIDDVQMWLEANVTKQHGRMFEVVEEINHSRRSFTEGLTYGKGVLYESIGLDGQSALLVLNSTSGDTVETYSMEKQYFGEGLTYMKGKLIQLTWKSKTGFIYNAKNLSKDPTTFTFSTTKNEGWGITYDPTRDLLIVSDGSEYLHFWDPETFEEHSIIKVRRQNPRQKANLINELEFWRGRVLANVWYEDTILVINPNTGKVEKEYGKSCLLTHASNV